MDAVDARGGQCAEQQVDAPRERFRPALSQVEKPERIPDIVTLSQDDIFDLYQVDICPESHTICAKPLAVSLGEQIQHRGHGGRSVARTPLRPRSRCIEKWILRCEKPRSAGDSPPRAR